MTNPAETLPTETILGSIRETTCRQCTLPVAADSRGDYVCGAGHRGNVWGHRLSYEIENQEAER